MSLGEKIMSLRESRGLTLAEFADAVGVSEQAVSEWENGGVCPDREQLVGISRFFGITPSYLLDKPQGGSEVAYASSSAQNKQAQAGHKMLGVCTDCGNMVYSGQEYSVSPKLVCKRCAQSKQEDAARIEREDKEMLLRRRNKGLIVGGVVTSVFLLLDVIGLVQNKEGIGDLILGSIVTTVLLFTFVSQLFYRGVITSICLTGCKMLGDIGVIFTLDLDGILFLIGFKIVWFLIRLLFFFLTVIFFALIAFIVSPFTFIPATIRISKGID